MKINLFRPKYCVEECLSKIRECLISGWTGYGPKSLEFENAWSEYTGLVHSHFLNSNTSGLHLALHILKSSNRWQDGDEIITTPLTFVSTNQAILYERLVPVFADVDEYLCLDPKSLESLISSKTRGVVFVGIGGNSGRFLEIVEICRKHGLFLVLDAAHMAGTRINGKQIGVEADVSVFSFQSVKNLPTADSGMICFKESKYDSIARKLSWLGIDKNTFSRTNSGKNYQYLYSVEDLGFKYHGNDIMAAIALVQLKCLEDGNVHRRLLADRYIKNLSGCANLSIVPNAPGCESSQHLFQIRTSERENLIDFLHNKSISPGIHYRDNMEYSLFSEYKRNCPSVDVACKEILSLPLHLELGLEAVDYVSDCIICWSRKNI
ncbi:MAG: DegT/DnrJ/EryC1/StrS family aminotransferase [Candidatus Riflebacteria bacterium]|nr:DegT/DnrJ/EryC1/StrS family aminotransferase [Candidatus Riflebacteria bacterium]